MKYYQLYANRIQYLCDKRGISINKFSKMCGVSQSTVNNIITGVSANPCAKTLHKIALGFSMTLSEFLDFEELNDYSFDDAEENEDSQK